MLHLKRATKAWLCLGFAMAAAGSASASNIVIVPTFDSTITSQSPSTAAAIEAGINNAITEVESKITNPITVNITFQSINSGLGSSQTSFNVLSYQQYRSDLLTNQTLSANDVIATSTLPNQTNNPANGDPNMLLTLPLLRAIGETSLGNNGGGRDSLIGLNTSIMNLSRTGPQNGGFYDLQSVAMHEISEVLGAGGAGSMLGQTGISEAGALDLFRYSAAGTRSFTTSSSATAYFSINGGVTNLSFFNQSGTGDFSDWAGKPFDPTIQVQDFAGTPGTQPDLSSNEVTAYDVIGYNVVPEPASLGLLALCGASLLLRRKGR